MDNQSEKTCADCTGPMKEIRVLYTNLEGHNELKYTVPEVKRGFWSAKYPVEGSIDAFMCQDCGLVKMYGVPDK